MGYTFVKTHLIVHLKWMPLLYKNYTLIKFTLKSKKKNYHKYCYFFVPEHTIRSVLVPEYWEYSLGPISSWISYVSIKKL